MTMTTSSRLGLAVLMCWALSACGGSAEGGGVSDSGDDCVSHYTSVVSAGTWPGLQTAMVGSSEWGRVASVRTQARGHDVGAGDEDAVRVVDLLNAKGRRLVQADVWRTDTGGWRAGVWSQCID